MGFEDLMRMARRRGFFWPSFEIYGGLAGFYDYGPLGNALMRRMEDLWRALFIGEGGLEIQTPTVNPEEVFQASGHLREFKDPVTRCPDCGESFKSDQIEGDRCPVCGGTLEKLGETRSLMFETKIGARNGGREGYLRPETAQGIFINFSNLYRINRDKLPLTAIQIGKGYRNEISPRQGMIRLREFTMAEVEIFLDTEDGGTYSAEDAEVLTLLPSGGEAIEVEARSSQDQVGGEMMAHQMHLAQRFLTEVGIPRGKIRFREHEKDELAHYANRCWDCEVYTEKYGWVEVIGIADRGTYDLEMHISESGVDLTALRIFDGKRMVKREVVLARTELLERDFQGAGRIKKALGEMDIGLLKMAKDEGGSVEVKVGDGSVEVGSSYFEILEMEDEVSNERFVPRVIEPSYGIDRILLMALFHSYSRDGDRWILKLPPRIAPVTLAIFPLIKRGGLDLEAKRIHKDLSQKLGNYGLICQYDESGSIGRRYARADEVGTPFCITIDHKTLEDGTVTLRDRDTTTQVRIKERDLFERILERIW